METEIATRFFTVDLAKDVAKASLVGVATVVATAGALFAVAIVVRTVQNYKSNKNLQPAE